MASEPQSSPRVWPLRSRSRSSSWRRVGSARALNTPVRSPSMGPSCRHLPACQGALRAASTVQPVTNPSSTALVLAGGGVAGIAWELGVLRGLADADPALADRVLAADLVVGTSAGSSVAAQVTSGVPLDELYQAQLRPETAEIEVDVDLPALVARVNAAMAGATSTEDAGRRIGALALATPTIDPALRLAAIDARLPVTTWPQRRLLIAAVDAGTGALAVFTRDSGVALRDAVAASCAVPGVWPPVTIDGRRYVDGGARSMANSDLAAGADRVLVLLPA